MYIVDMFKRIKNLLFILDALAIFAGIIIYIGNMREIPTWVCFAVLSALNIPIWYDEAKQDYITSQLEQRILIMVPIVALCASIIYGLVSIFLLK